MKQITEQLTELPSPTEVDGKRKIKRHGLLSQRALARENHAYAATAGVSKNCQSGGFVPAFYDTLSDCSVISRYPDGSPAPIHLLDGVPVEWVSDYDAEGHVAALRPGVISGFLRAGRFYTREQVANAG
ncbi:hypothetical protein [Sedimenticola selenatireducens]|uniref:hypothetical protein n=1 Tax=Sedimenticola selenatireducens TaxID=191960 RepID=UPI0023527ACB|nr:hypothetical protein [Sedimenticola selenatireducens]